MHELSKAEAEWYDGLKGPLPARIPLDRDGKIAAIIGFSIIAAQLTFIALFIL